MSSAAFECVLAETNSRLRVLSVDHRHAQKVLAASVGDAAAVVDLTMVGGLDELQVFAVGVRDAAALPLNPYCTDSTRFDVPVRGPVLFIGSDAAGEPIDVPAEALLRALVAVL
jgi:hypothetical protein